MAALFEFSGVNQPKVWRYIIGGLLIVVITGLVCFAIGYYKASSNCTTINANKISPSVEAAQEAARNTAKYSVVQEVLKAKSLTKVDEVQDECKSSKMPADLITELNR